MEDTSLKQFMNYQRFKELYVNILGVPDGADMSKELMEALVAASDGDHSRFDKLYGG